jgi:hypothetical protein
MKDALGKFAPHLRLEDHQRPVRLTTAWIALGICLLVGGGALSWLLWTAVQG